MEENIEITENYSYDVLDKTPRWLIRWGIIAVGVTIAALLCIAAIIPYYETIRFPVMIGQEEQGYVIAPVSGSVTQNKLLHRTEVNRGDTLLVIAVPGLPDTYITAQTTGYVFYLNNEVFNISNVGKGDTLLKIAPPLREEDGVMAVGFLAEKKPGLKMAAAKVAHIKLALNDGSVIRLERNAMKISDLPDAPAGHIVTIMLDSSSLSQVSGHQQLYERMPADVTVTLKGKSMLKWIFD
jgi:hypothetical protein